MTVQDFNIRSGTIQHLCLLSSAQKQLDYETSVPIAQVPTELICRWFDDLGYGNNAISTFKPSFNPDELNHLEVFHQKFEEATNEIDPLPITVAELQVLPEWNTVIKAAVTCLKNIQPQG